MIVSCGEALIDFVPQKTQGLTYAPCPGGSPYNLAIASARLGAPTAFLGKISHDFFGDMLYDRLVAEGVDTCYTQRSERHSTLAFVKIEEGREPRYAFFTENTADRNLVSVDIPEEFPDEVQCLEFGSISLLLEPQASTIRSLIRRESGKRAISFDPNIRPLLVGDKTAFKEEVENFAAMSTIIKISIADLDYLYPGSSVIDCANKFLAAGSGLVVITRGKDGAVLYGPKYQVDVPEYWVEVKDTIGAGDTFHAALLVRLRQLGRLNARCAEYLTREEAQDAVEFAVKASSLNCARQGADPPRAAEMAGAESAVD